METIKIDVPTTLSKQCTTSGSNSNGQTVWNGQSFNVTVTYTVTANMVKTLLHDAVKSAIIKTQRAFRDNVSIDGMTELQKTGYTVALDNAGTKPLTRSQMVADYESRTATLTKREKIDVMYRDGLIDDDERAMLYEKHGIESGDDATE